MKYRKKPVVIDAFQWNGEEVPGFSVRHVPSNGTDQPMVPHLVIPTLEGTMLASIGDYIITGVRNEVYPCKPDIFAATYEPVEDDAA